MIGNVCRMVSGEMAASLTAVPSGLIFLLNDTSIPAGYSRFSNMDNRHPVAAGDTYAVGATGGTALAFSRNTAYGGAHVHATGSLFGQETGGAISYPVTADAASSGSHRHLITSTYNREYRQLVFIKATQSHSSFPADGIVLSIGATTPVTGLSQVYDNNLILRGGSSIATGGGFSGSVCENAGSHIHAPGTQALGGAAYANVATYNGLHSHSITISVSQEELTRAYLTAWTKATSFASDSGIIAMWESAIPPQGWYLCDGNNGTTDLRNCFIILSDTGNAGDTYSETNRVEVSASLDTNAWSHTHAGAPGYVNTTKIGSGPPTGASHSHSSSAAWDNYTPPYYALTFIQKA